MRIAFMGSGGLGGYFGARLCDGGADVHFVARGQHLAAMREHGLHIEGPEPLLRRLAGGAVELGKRKGVSTPLTRAIADILALHATGNKS